MKIKLSAYKRANDKFVSKVEKRNNYQKKNYYKSNNFHNNNKRRFENEIMC